MIPSVKRDSALPTGKLARIVTTRNILLVYVGDAKGRGLLASTITMVHPSRVETTIEETSEANFISGATMAAMEATGATSHAETFMKYKLMTSYRTNTKNKAATTAMMIMLMIQNRIGWSLK